jgi:hypothetical protein
VKFAQGAPREAFALTKTSYPDVQFLIKSDAYHNDIFWAYSNRRGVDGSAESQLAATWATLAWPTRMATF